MNCTNCDKCIQTFPKIYHNCYIYSINDLGFFNCKSLFSAYYSSSQKLMYIYPANSITDMKNFQYAYQFTTNEQLLEDYFAIEQKYQKLKVFI